MILWKSRWVGGVFQIGNPEGRGVGVAQAVLEIQVEGRGVQKYAFHRGGGGVWIFSGITH